ncbi:hypothetical protein HNQ91_003702 [Filimonas zeae]|uniref:Uncharacterized protein n=1 Tax=Filimonas zeae TaxID=1737353 RepID=A0A917J1N3_9BACT|nr:hypothetical protein [Filimonas zeae]MDR6340637.1 hypothetical protein [Filimonas zeae]GGH73670.1 hypothetical protein GCM10011379_35430 [Filimonas zeae]
MSAKLEAHFENRIYFFVIEKKEPNELTVNLYGTQYTFEKTDKGWMNKKGNRMNMVPGLIKAVVNTAYSL